MISQETIDGLIDALSDLSEATNNIIHGGGEVPAEARVINSLNSSSTTDALSANMGRELKEMIENIEPPTVDAYTKTETDALLDTKADKSTTYTKAEVDTALSGKANVGASYTKSEANTLLAGKADTGDSYTKSEDNALLANKADKSNTYTKSEVDALIQGGGTPVDAYTKSETDALLATKANSADVYTKTEANSLLATKANSADVYGKTEVYTKSEVNTALTGKADASTTYTKTEVDTALASKANASTTYTKTEVDTLVEGVLPSGDASDVGKVLTKIGANSEGWVNAQASYTDYSNTSSGLNATTVQGAIDEVNTAVGTKASTTDVTNKANLKLATSGNTATGEIRFGKDGNGNYGYIPEGADTVVPFSSGGSGEPALIGLYANVGRIGGNYPSIMAMIPQYDTTKYDTTNVSPSSTQKFFMKVVTTTSSTTSIYEDDLITIVKNGNNIEWTPKADCIFRRNGYKPQAITANTTQTFLYSVADLYDFQFYDN